MKRTKARASLIFVIILLILPVFILSPYVFSGMMPTRGGDVRAHLGRIIFITDKIQGSEFPLWDAYWYAGYPFYSSYPQLAYYLPLPISLLTTPIFALNMIRYFSVLVLVFAVYTFLNSITDSKKSFLLSLFLILNPFILFMTYSMTIPNILGWGFGILFMAYFLSTGSYGKTILFGSLTLLAHPYALIFSGLSIFVFLIVKRFQKTYTKKFLVSLTFMFLLSSFWLIPAISNMPYMSSFREGFLTDDIIFLVISMPLLLFLTMRTMRNRDDFGSWILIMAWLSVILSLFSLFPSIFLGIRILRLCYPFFLTVLAALNLKDLARYSRTFVTVMLVLILIPGLHFIIDDTWRYSQHEPDPILGYTDRESRIIGIELPTMEADTFLTFAAESKVMSLTGPFNQGDPKFDILTHIPEWEWWRMTGNPILAKNIMHETFSRYIYSNNLVKGFNATSVLESHPINKKHYHLIELQEPVNYAISVSPILLYSDRRIVEELDAKSSVGYKFVFIDREYENLYDFRILMTDETNRLSDIETEGETILIYHSDGRIEYENRNYSLENLEPLFTDMDLKYSPVDWERASTEEIKVSADDQEFILVKESWHPGWESEDAGIMRDKHGFIVIVPEKSEVTLRFQERYLFHGITVSLTGLVLFVIFRKRIYAS